VAIDQALRDGRVGTPGFGHHTVYRDRMKNPAVFTRGESWPVIHATGIHNIDLFRFWFGGRIRRVSFRGIDCSWNPYRDPGAVTGWLEMESGVVIAHLTSFISVVATDPSRHPYEDNVIQGSEGALHWNGPWDRGPVELMRGDAESPEEILPKVDDWPAGMVRLMDSLAATLREGAPLFGPADDNLWSLAALFAAEQSAEQDGKIVDAIRVGQEAGAVWRIPG
jgi:predicted dehydrogenase